MRSAAERASLGTDPGFAQTQDGGVGNSMFIATSGTPMGHYAASAAGDSWQSKNFTNVNFSNNSNARQRTYQSRYRTQALQNLATSQRYVLQQRLPGRPKAGPLDQHLRYKGSLQPNPVSASGYSGSRNNAGHNSLAVNYKGGNMANNDSTFQSTSVRTGVKRDLRSRSKGQAASGWG